MRLLPICLVLCGVASLTMVDAGLLRSKARLLGKLGRHRKRGILGSVPTFKLGHDIPHVTHSVVKPVVVTYPPAATVTPVKVPLIHPLLPRFPHAHSAPASHPHWGKFPHTKSVILPRPDQHFHHHHHHVAPRPAIPLLPAPAPAPAPVAPLVPVAQPSVPVPQPLPPPLFARPAPLIPAPPPLLPLRPAVNPLLPAAAVPLQPAPTVQYTPQLQYLLRPGNAIQTSYFATYPRYPLVNYRPLIPVAVNPVPVAPAPVVFQQPAAPHFHVAPSPAVPLPSPALHLPPTPQVTVQHDGWAPLQPHSHDVALHEAQQHFAHDAHNQFADDVHHQYAHDVHHQFTDAHHQLAHDSHHQFAQDAHAQFAQDAHAQLAQDAHAQFAQDAHAQFAQDAHAQFSQDAHPHFSQEPGTQVYEQHTGEDQHYHELQRQLQQHVQQQVEQAQFEQHLGQEYGAPQLPGHEYRHPHQDGQEYSQHQDYNYQQPGAEYGTPGVEGRSGEGGGEGEAEGGAGGVELKFHNHIPLGLQPPLDRPLEHFR